MKKRICKKNRKMHITAPASSWQKLPDLLRLYQQGVTEAIEPICILAAPLVDKLSNVPYFTAKLGKEETRSRVTLSLLEYLQDAPPDEDWQRIPHNITHAIKCDLLNQIQWLQTRRSCERREAEENEEENDTQDVPDASRFDPEYLALQEERNRMVRECLQQLGPKERTVITGFYFRQLSIREIAVEMNCSTANVSSTKRNALYKLRKLFEEKQVAVNFRD